MNFIHLHLNYVVQLMLLCYQKHGPLPTHVMICRVTPAFIHIVLTKQEAVPPCLAEIVTHAPIWPICQCNSYYEISVVKVSLSNNCTVIIIGVYGTPDKKNCHQFHNLTMYSQLATLILTFQIPLPQKMILLTTDPQIPSSRSSINPLAMLITIQVFQIKHGLIRCTTHSMVYFYQI